ncbi:hypothetical protein JCM17846_15410 [Iodidimonas nitroreducens]|uniref:Aminotransferase class V domain-containing protein n=1 Tax=Iodidimonas nitroreducens TaxID=1236968 RepID=A0A5A7N9V8_9PROT|nr:aminotransferase class V-fold PLP-dependent enzyme [Iodidimonas nitroreducens]GER03859.1 hypothetical protein JCM17846_15410 [Iodidimonas nitroreducens]
MPMNRTGRPSHSGEGTLPAPFESFSGHRGLRHEEPLIFEIGDARHSGVDIEDAGDFQTALGGLERNGSIGLPGLSEPQTVRHFTRLSQKNYGIDSGFFPLGSCTMKHNPRLNEKVARLPGLADIHPLQPQSTVQGALAVMRDLSHWLMTLTGMPAVALNPKAGAHGELCGIMAIRAALEARGDARKIILVPESAHGTNPATAVFCGYQVKAIPAGPDGRVDLEALKKALGPDVAGIMLTNPNTCGLFERDIIKIAEAVHEAGGFFYCDGANFNASWAGCGPVIWASMPCTSICTKPFPRPMAAAGRVRGRWFFLRLWPLMRLCPMWLKPTMALPYMNIIRARMIKALAASWPFTGRWACMCGLWPICSATAMMACANWPKMPCSMPIICWRN